MQDIGKKYLDGMCRRDIGCIASVLTEASTVVMLDGRVYKGGTEILDMHEKWFGDSDWSISYEVDTKYETESTYHALVKIQYLDKNMEGNPYQIQYYLFLLFGKDGEAWTLLHDQNTLIRE